MSIFDKLKSLLWHKYLVMKKGAKMEWISVKDKWPPDGQAVILCIEIDYSVGYIYTSGAFVAGRWKINESYNLLDTDCYEYEDSYADDITHWMPLPPPPSSHNGRRYV